MDTSIDSVELNVKRSSLKRGEDEYVVEGKPKMKRSLSFADEKGTNLIKVTYSDKLHYSEGIGATAKGCCIVS